MEANNRYRDLLQLLGISLELRECLGFAKTKFRKCRCQISINSQTQASQILLDFSTTAQTLEDAKYTMALVAGLLLCRRYHQGQNFVIGNSWMDKIRGSTLIIQEPVLSPSLNSRRRPTRASQRRSQSVQAEQPPEQRSDSATPSQTVSNRRVLRSDTRNTRSSYQVCGICKEEYDADNGEILKCLLCENIMHKGCGEDWMDRSSNCPYW
jgi:hypothetical protein